MIRAYREQDWQAVCDIWNRARPDELRGVCEADLIKPLQDDSALADWFEKSEIVVAEIDGRVVGFGGFKDTFIGWLYVDPFHYRQGYGSLILEELLARVGPGARLHVAASNRPAVKLYQKFGFEITKQFDSKFRDCPVSVLIMEKE